MTFHAVEIGCRGYISNRNMASLKTIYDKLNKKDFKELKAQLATQAVVSSFVVFYAKYSKLWINNV